MNTPAQDEAIREVRIAIAIGRIHYDRSITRTGDIVFASIIALIILGAVGGVTYAVQEDINLSPVVCVLIAAASLFLGGFLSYKNQFTIPILVLDLSAGAYIITQHGSTPSIVLALMIAIPSQIGSRIYNQMIAKNVKKPIISLGTESDQQVQSFLTTTYNAWKSGTLNAFSENFQKKIELKSLDDFVKDYYASWNVFSYPLSKESFNSDEFLIFLAHSGIRTSFILTNQRLFYFGIDEEMNIPNNLGIVNLSEINHYEFELGSTLSKVKLDLNDNDTVAIKNLLYADILKYYFDFLFKEKLHA